MRMIFNPQFATRKFLNCHSIENSNPPVREGYKSNNGGKV